ncbi:Rieske (2Fe-2S) protein [Rhodoferax sp.]|uniref:Rieske (2Fe-2S) protein n=1 Tax=Rhodoferax sp. TaxID=50421 RepID=UPI0027489E7E|nr:Rieske 2Fe-2S domain-containing protein [Rhodoferax sp.]
MAPYPAVAPEGEQIIGLCASGDLVNAGEAVPFDVTYHGQSCRGFAIRYAGQVHAYLNRCAHVPMEMDYQDNRFFDSSGLYLMCATHGAIYRPQTGECAGGPCRGGLVKIALTEQDGLVHWHTGPHLKPR